MANARILLHHDYACELVGLRRLQVLDERDVDLHAPMRASLMCAYLKKGQVFFNETRSDRDDIRSDAVGGQMRVVCGSKAFFAQQPSRSGRLRVR